VPGRIHRQTTTLGLLILIASGGVAALRAQGVVEIRMRGRYLSEPATVEITIAVEPNAHNRVLRVEADGEQLFRCTEVQLQGAKEQRIHVVEFKNLPAGYYAVRAQVLSGADVRGTAEHELVVGEPADQDQ
jgi:hypothetical protein